MNALGAGLGTWRYKDDSGRVLVPPVTPSFPPGTVGPGRGWLKDHAPESTLRPLLSIGPLRSDVTILRSRFLPEGRAGPAPGRSHWPCRRGVLLWSLFCVALGLARVGKEAEGPGIFPRGAAPLTDQRKANGVAGAAGNLGDRVLQMVTSSVAYSKCRPRGSPPLAFRGPRSGPGNYMCKKFLRGL